MSMLFGNKKVYNIQNALTLDFQPYTCTGKPSQTPSKIYIYKQHTLNRKMC